MIKKRKRLSPLQRISALGRIRSALRDIDAIVADILSSLRVPKDYPATRKRRRK